MPGKKYGYARVSTVDQDPELQIIALRQDGCDRRNIFVDRGRSGIHADRPQLAKCLARLESGDMLVVWKLDRLGRNTRHMLEIAEDLHRRGVNLRCLTQSIDTSSPMGKVIFTVLSAVAEYEHSLILERTSEGRKLAKERGDVKFGRKAVMTKEKRAAALRLTKTGTNAETIATALEVSRSSVYRTLREALPARFPRSQKKKRHALKAMSQEPAPKVYIRPELQDLIETQDPVLRAALERELGMSRWDAVYEATGTRLPIKSKTDEAAKKKPARLPN